MTPFLEQVARHYYGDGGIEDICFIFPNRRAMVFFRKYLSLCAASGKRALLSPKMFTMNDFFYENAGVQPTDDTRLLVELYSCYKELNKTPESLDDFIFWGGVLLSDFNDVDKYLVDPRMLFRNVSDFRGLSDGDSALNDTQKAAIERLVAHFKTPGHYKDEFRKIWDIMYPLYESFIERLSEKGYAYEGMVYRRIAESLKEKSAVDVLGGEFSNVKKFVFVGLNALNECEKLLLRRLRNARLAEFCWDYSGEWIKDPHNKSSFFLKSNVEEFPQAFSLDDDAELPMPEFHVLGVPSTVGQAKQLPSILDRIGAKGIETAVVLPDETLLLSVLNTIPERIRDINVTMGYPMNGSGIWSFMDDIASLQMHLRKNGEEWTFYHRTVYAVFSNSIFKAVCDEKVDKIISDVKREAKYYIPLSSLTGHPLFDLIFKPVVLDPKDSGGQTAKDFGNYLLEVISEVAPKLKGKSDMTIELDFAKEYYLAIGRILDCNLSLRPDSFFRLIEKTIGRATVPFRGEPLNGLQIMGPLETRAVDFDNVVILSCNEGIFPSRNVSPSFIPPELRRGFDLPTYEYQDAVWAYYFYRLIRRAKRVWMLYDSHPEGLKSGEESRYIKQLELHFGANLKRYDFKSTVGKVNVNTEIPKTKEHIETLRKERRLSATALQSYLNCKVQFFYGTVLNLSKPDDIEQDMDARILGTVFHSVMQQLYKASQGHLRRDYLNSLLSGNIISHTVRDTILQTIKCPEITGRNLIYEDMICRYVRKTVRYDISILEKHGKDEFLIVGLEKPVSMEIGGFRFYGIIDRLDSLTPGEWRIVDYKTGAVGKYDLGIDDKTAEGIVAKIFGPKSKDRPKIALQLYLYDRFIKENNEHSGKSKNLVNSVYGVTELLKGTVRTEEVNDKFTRLMDEKIGELLCEMADENVPFSFTEDLDCCEKCDFKTICGR